MTKDVFQIAAWAVAVVGGLIGAFKAIAEWRKDLRWKQAEMAKTCLDEMWNDQLACAALRMLDWTGLSFKTPDGDSTSPIYHEQRRTSLRIVDTVFPPGVRARSFVMLLTRCLTRSKDSNILFAST